jgi:glycosyltransferase involved in cell wall biosynthesis
MKIIQANKYFYKRGGAESYMFQVYDWLEDQGHDVVPFAMKHHRNLDTSYDMYFPSNVRTAGVSFGWQGLRTLGRMLYSVEARRKCAQLINATRADVMHVHNLYTQLSPSPLHAARDWNVPVVMTVHDHHLISPQYNIPAEDCGLDVSGSGVIGATMHKFHKDSYAASFAQAFTQALHRGFRMYEKHVDRFICPSEYLAGRLVNAGFPEERVTVIPYGIDPKTTVPRYAHDNYFLFAGRLSVEKGVEMIIRLAKLLPEIRFKIAGTGPDKERLHRMAHPFDNIEFVGHQSGEDLHDLYRGAKAVLVPSRVRETFSLSALEAMAFGAPVVASDAGAIPEVVDDRHSGFLVPPTDIEGWVEAVVRLDHNEGLRERMARQAREEVGNAFHINDHYRRLLDVYRAVLGND